MAWLKRYPMNDALSPEGRPEPVEVNGMTAALKWNLISVEDYLESELSSPAKHEYLAGVIYAMAGARNAHNRIASNILGELHGRLRGHPCQPYNSDTKIRIRMPTHMRFYYPDTSVICHPNPPNDSFQDEPAVIFEVLSRNTRRIDDGEKKDAYLSIPSLNVYALVEQDEPAVVVFRRRGTEFIREVYSGLDAVLPLQDIGVSLPLAEIYNGVQFVPESAPEE
jgi:Uma2 family endonuclease